MTPISAPPTPVTPTHVISMERCRSSEAVLGSGPCGSNITSEKEKSGRDKDGRDGRKRDIKATSLLFRGLPSNEEIRSVEVELDSKKDEVEHVEEVREEEDEMMDIDEPVTELADLVPAVWGMPKWGKEDERKEVRKGVRLIGMEEVRLFNRVWI